MRVGLRHAILMLWLLALVWSGAIVSARELLRETRCDVPAEQTVRGTLLALCQELHIAGRVEGDVIALAWRTTISGEVLGSAYIGSTELYLSGAIHQSLHFGGIMLQVDPTPPRLAPTGASADSAEATPPIPAPATAEPAQNASSGAETPDPSHPQAHIAGSLLSASLKTRLARGAVLERQLITLSYELESDAHIGGELNFWGTALNLGGRVSGDVYAQVGDPATDSAQIRTLLLPFGFDIALSNPGIYLKTGTRLSQDLIYSGYVPLSADQLRGRVRGATQFTAITPPLITLEEPSTIAVYVQQWLREFSSLLVIALVGYWFLPHLMRKPLAALQQRPIASLSVGMLAFLVSFPVTLIALLLSAALVLALVIVGAQGVATAVGVVLAMFNGGVASLFYFMAIFVARVLTAWRLGQMLLPVLWRKGWRTRHMALTSLIMGVAVLSLLSSLPVIGWLINGAALFLGLGAILSTLSAYLRPVREAPALAGMSLAPSPVQPPTLIISEPEPSPPPRIEAHALGMENLPQGFNPDSFFKD